MARGDVTDLVKRLISYSEALDRNVTAMQQAFDKVQESFANLRRVWAGDAAETFYVDWMQTADGLEGTFESGRRLMALLDERLASLRLAERAILDIAGASVPGRSEGPKQIPQRLPGTTFQAMRHAEANAILEAKLKGITGTYATLYVDQPVCSWCRPALGPLARWLGVDKLRVVDATGDLGEF